MPQVPSVQAMMARDEASRGLGIELVDHFRGRSHQLAQPVAGSAE